MKFNNIVFQLHTCTSLTKSAVLLRLCLYLPEDDPVEDETCGIIISDKIFFFISDFAICLIKCSAIGLVHGVWITSSMIMTCSLVV